MRIRSLLRCRTRPLRMFVAMFECVFSYRDSNHIPIRTMVARHYEVGSAWTDRTETRKTSRHQRRVARFAQTGNHFAFSSSLRKQDRSSFSNCSANSGVILRLGNSILDCSRPGISKPIACSLEINRMDSTNGIQIKSSPCLVSEPDASNCSVIGCFWTLR